MSEPNYGFAARSEFGRAIEWFQDFDAVPKPLQKYAKMGMKLVQGVDQVVDVRGRDASKVVYVWNRDTYGDRPDHVYHEAGLRTPEPRKRDQTTF